jgi:hypothetical protein
VGSVYAREKRKWDQAGLVPHTKHMGDYWRGLTRHMMYTVCILEGGVSVYTLVVSLKPGVTPVDTQPSPPVSEVRRNVHGRPI